MKKITAKEFLAMIENNPSVFEHWNTPLEITEFVDCEGAIITHLSPYLTFSGKNEKEESARFFRCPNLKTATGTFQNTTDFSCSSVKKIENLHVGKNNTGFSAWFYSCKSLKVATGNYPGSVDFCLSGIHSIQNLHIENPNKNEYYADFETCPNLQTLGNWDLSKKIKIEDEKFDAEIKRRASLKNFIQETKPQPLPFL